MGRPARNQAARCVLSSVALVHTSAIHMIIEIGLLLSAFQSVAAPNAGGQAEPAYCTLAVSDDGRLVAAGDAEGRVQVFDGELKPLLELPMGFEGGPWQLEFAPGGRKLAGLGLEGGLAIWNFNQSGPVPSATLVGAATAIEFESKAARRGGRFTAVIRWSPTGERLGLATRGGDHSLWTKSGKCLASWKAAQNKFWRIPKICWTADGEHMISSDGSAIEIRNGDTGALSSKFGGQIDCGSHVMSFDLHPNDSLLATGHTECEMRLWDLSTGEKLEAKHFRDPDFPEPQDKICDMRFAPNGSLLGMSISKSSFVFVYDLRQKRTTFTSDFLGAHFDESMPIAWSLSGKTLWYSFECSGAVAHQVVIASGITHKRKLGDLPRFGDGLSVQLAGGKPQRVRR